MSHESRDAFIALEEERIKVVVDRAYREGTIGVPQHFEPSTVMQGVALWESQHNNWIPNLPRIIGV